MQHQSENVINSVVVALILCNHIMGSNSKSSILWKLNDKSGKIDSYSENHQHVSIHIRALDSSSLIWMCCLHWGDARVKRHINVDTILGICLIFIDFRSQLAKEIREIYENDAVFSIIASASGIRTTGNSEKDVHTTCTADYLYSYRATKWVFFAYF